MEQDRATNALTAALEDAPVAILVCEAQTRTLLYANRLAERTLMDQSAAETAPCYRALGRQTPCEGCPLEQGKGPCRAEFCLTHGGRTYQVSGKSMPWDGKDAYIEYFAGAPQSQDQPEAKLDASSGNLQTIINAIPGGVAIYKVTDIFETLYFSDGVPQLSGYTVEEYRRLTRQDALRLTCPEDVAMVRERARQVIRDRSVDTFEFRKPHRDGHTVWVRVQVKYMGQEDGCPLLHCVFHNISDLKEAQLELEHLVNAIPGGIASYKIEGDRFVPTYFSDSVPELSGYTRPEFEAMVQKDALSIIYEQDRPRVLAALDIALKHGTVLDVSYRTRHKGGGLTWIHLNGRRLDPDSNRFYAVFTGMSEEARLFQLIANESADGIYVIDKNNYDLLYVNESRNLFGTSPHPVGQKCYAALQHKSAPCEFCTLNTHEADGQEHEMIPSQEGRVYTTRFRQTQWNGVDAYIKFVRDASEEVRIRQEKERLSQYFETLVANLPGGVAVVRAEKDGRLVPEFMSEGFAAMTGMTQTEAWALYRDSAMAGVHPKDRERVLSRMQAYFGSNEPHCEIVYRLLKGDGNYLWVKNTLSLILDESGQRRVYSMYHDMTQERAEQARLRKQYEDLILEHYRSPSAQALVLGHCNITKDKILEIIDYTHAKLLTTLGSRRTDFFTGLSRMIVDPAERTAFLAQYMNQPALDAFARGEREKVQCCFVQIPGEARGRYVKFQMNMVAAPDSGDVTGILTVTDITESTISERILNKLSVAAYDFVVDVDLSRDAYRVLYASHDAHWVPPTTGCYSEWTGYMLKNLVVPRDRARYQRCLDPRTMLHRLKVQGDHTFSFSLATAEGEMRTKNMTVSAIDLGLGRVCLSRTDITESVQEQQGLLNMIASTFEWAGLIRLSDRRLTMHTRQTILESLAPYVVDDYEQAVKRLVEYYGLDEQQEDLRRHFRLGDILQRLAQKPEGYDFVCPYHREGEQVRYKQINVLWGDAAHSSVCIVRADVTDMLAAERQGKERLEKALIQAEQANRAKSDFLSTMSHDIRTPMNAIMGMTALALAHLDDKERLSDCLNKISLSSRHLLSLINDILDMNKIEQAKVTLNRGLIRLDQLLDQLAEMMQPQARAAGLNLDIRSQDVAHPCFYGDLLRINQILINLVSNAVKFTGPGGSVTALAQEIAPQNGAGWVRYRFTVSDTGIGMSEEFIAHLFEPFTRSAHADQVEGTGLGLSITKGLVDLMGGAIQVESRVGQGSVFRVELECQIAQPDAPDAPNPVQETAGQGDILKGRHFLVAEDNAINGEILLGLLEMFGAGAQLTTDGAQAVAAFEKAPPGTFDAILMDIRMPRMDGYAATRAIRALERPDAAAIPIIAMTANAFSEDVQASLDAGMNAHVAKPIDLQVLRNTLRGCLGND